MQFGLSSTLACNILADVSGQARYPLWWPWLSERDVVWGERNGEAGGGRCRANLLVKALCVCVGSDLCKWSLFPLHLAKEKAASSVTSLLICPTNSHFLMCFKRLIWWQDYIKPTEFLNAFLANISTSLQVHRYLLPVWLGLCYELQAWDREVRLDHFPQSSGFQTTEPLRVS